ncbi:hypothetical protein D3879_04415 [Pseudomonas cavernicola]|uniref:DUF6160 domain-containing protein n=1 Tax=Pseudomonas cavernicola TaxID=2320866 RepID=A0A418XJ82_9PSED|nr:DUF6160 family protein [Pseudomonas cavernicola]RJG12538.1 hypothetical protein D3879_04415 [Pseudomonas cavernicola]
MFSLRNLLLLPLVCGSTLLALPSQAALLALDNQSLSEVSGQAGISIRLDLMARINELRWSDTTGNVSLRNIKIDNGCVNPGDCPNGAGGSFALGAAQLGLVLPIFGVNQPTLMIDVVKNASGQEQLQFTLPDLTTINQQLIASGLAAQRIRLRVLSDMYVGTNRLGSLEIRDITDLHGSIKVWGH